MVETYRIILTFLLLVIVSYVIKFSVIIVH